MSDRATPCLAAWLVLGCLLTGCGGPPKPPPSPADGAQAAREPQSQRDPPTRPPGAEHTSTPTAEEPQTPQPPLPTGPPETPDGRTDPEQRAPSTGSADRPVDSEPRWIDNLPRLRVDHARAAAAGIRRLAGRRLILYTDLPPSEEIDELPAVVGQAFPQWCAYFDLDEAKYADWSITGFLMKDKARFQQAGLLPENLPPFEHGFSRNCDVWVYDQPSSYYVRHLLLHEGTHALMNSTLGGCGPPWYMEGIAEMLATHRWRDGQLTLGQIPADRDEAPYWGRIRIIRDAIATGDPMPLRKVVESPAQAFLEKPPYAWSWAAATLLDRHPRYRDRFRQLPGLVLRPDFNGRFLRLFADDWDQLCEEWLLLVTALEYGHDVARTAVDFTPGRPLPDSGAEVTLAADRGWQNSGLRLDGGASYQLRASGRYQVAAQPQVWWCEPGGVSIRYYAGRPLGVLLAAVRADQGTPESSALLRPTVVGLGATLSPGQSGTLYLKINDSAGELADNAGELKVEVEPQ